ncbi:FecR family protein [Pseudochryseolinea flava]|uniref:Anti-sigma factor n=1 Tax=Pseudochryseolinea flava TaxID=2059302 RepID=A0A364XY70_9BACT|nr:FecR family protein [Pseudochryseolinea flava]RAV99245.1 anti-sigma factor [Pseudochryseolinea flava]
MNRANFTSDDFIMDEYFQRWIFSPDDETDTYWRNYLHENPHQQAVVTEAKEFLHVFTIDKNDGLQSRIGNLKKRVNQAIDSNAPLLQDESISVQSAAVISIEKNTTRRIWYAAAACVAICAVTILLWEVAFPSTQLYSTDRGHRSIITLEDGTKVWLNVDSKLTAPKSFNGKPSREVTLNGEAFFEVTKNPNQPFIVHTADLNVKVLGTSFNVSAYPEQRNVETTLVEGKVSIATNGSETKSITLLPNQRAIYQKESKNMTLVDQKNTASLTGWKDGNLNFENIPLDEIIAALERWYNVTIHIPANTKLKCRFSAKVETKTLEEVLELFQASEGITYEIKGKDVYIEGFICAE